jgi:hypothetical protein
VEKDYINLLVLPQPPRAPGVEPDLSALSRDIKIDQYTLRDRLLGRGPAILKRTADREEIDRISGKLGAAGYAHARFADSEFRALPPARRVVTVKLGPDRVDFLNARGEAVNFLARGEKCLLAAGDLAPQDLSARQLAERASAPPAELLESIAMGEAVLDIYPGNRPPRVRIFGKHFNYAALGTQSGKSSAQNLMKMVEILRSLSAGSRLDLAFGFAVPPPIGGVSLSPAESPTLDLSHQEKLRRFENYSRALGLVYEQVTDPAAPPETAGPAAPSPSRPGPPVIPRTGASPLSALQAGLDRVRAWGPPAVFFPLVAAGILLGAGYHFTEDPRWLPPLGGIAGLLLFFHGFVCLKRARRIENIPTSRIRSLPMGTVEVSGQALSPAVLKTPFTLLDCVWYRFTVEEYRRSGRRSRYVVVARGNSEDIPFYVEDETGRITVDPRGALVEVKCRQVTYQSPEGLKLDLLGGGRGSRRITEFYIPWQYPVYVIGTAQPAKADPGSEQAEILTRLRELKQSPEKLAAFDLNRDGRIDSEEWERARAEAEREILAEKLRSPAVEEQVFVGRGDADELFLVSDRSERELLRNLRVRALLGVLGGGGLILAMVYWGWRLFVPD